MDELLMLNSVTTVPKTLHIGDEDGIWRLSYRRIDEFQPENESIAAYLKRVELFFSANDIAAEKQVPVFLSVIGGRTYSLL